MATYYEWDTTYILKKPETKFV